VLDTALSKLRAFNSSAWGNVSAGWKITTCQKSNQRISLVQLLRLECYSTETQDRGLHCKVYRSAQTVLESENLNPCVYPCLKFIACLLKMSFNYVHISGVVTNKKIINVERTLHTRGKIFNDKVNLKCKQSNWHDTALWNTHLLIKQIGFVVTKSHTELLIL